MAGVEPRLVGEPVEELGLHVVEQAAEVVGVAEGVADATGEERVAGEQVRVAVGVVVEQGDRAGRVAGEGDDLERASPTSTRRRRSTGRVTGTPVCSVMASASGAPATTSAPVASTTSASARWWSQCRWVVTTARAQRRR